jgi:hypothetical protein
VVDDEMNSLLKYQKKIKYEFSLVSMFVVSCPIVLTINFNPLTLLFIGITIRASLPGTGFDFYRNRIETSIG